MTKLLFGEDWLAYRQAMTDMAHQTLRDTASANAPQLKKLPRTDLLPAPRIDLIDLFDYQGQEDGLIFVDVSNCIGDVEVCVSITDAEGNLIENNDAVEGPEGWGHFGYGAMESVASGTTLTIHAVATDTLGGVAAASVSLTIL